MRYSQQLHLQVGDRDGDVHVGVEGVRTDSADRNMIQVLENADVHRLDAVGC